MAEPALHLNHVATFREQPGGDRMAERVPHRAVTRISTPDYREVWRSLEPHPRPAALWRLFPHRSWTWGQSVTRPIATQE